MAKLYFKCANVLLFNTAIRIFIEGQLEFSINSLLNIQNVRLNERNELLAPMGYHQRHH